MTQEKPTLAEALNDWRDPLDNGSLTDLNIIYQAARKYAAIKALVDAGTHAFVEVEPTESMTYHLVGHASEHSQAYVNLVRKYKAMLKAAPKNDLLED